MDTAKFFGHGDETYECAGDDCTVYVNEDGELWAAKVWVPQSGVGDSITTKMFIDHPSDKRLQADIKACQMEIDSMSVLDRATPEGEKTLQRLNRRIDLLKELLCRAQEMRNSDYWYALCD